jgi:probable aminopeptidase NPEPL1
VQLHVLLTSDAQALAAANALARALPLYSRKSAPPAPRTLTATFSTPSGPLSAEAHASLEHFAGAVRTAARLVDTPTAELHTTALVAEVQAVADAHPQTVKATIISGDDLLEHGLRALHGVGRAASRPPALAALHYTPSKPAPAGAPHLALVGKGIVYDTGGLNIKVR